MTTLIDFTFEQLEELAKLVLTKEGEFIAITLGGDIDGVSNVFFAMEFTAPPTKEEVMASESSG